MREKSYRELQAELDDVLAKLQSENLDIDESVTLYEQGMELIAKLDARLKQAENKIQKLKTKFDSEGE